MEEEAMTGDRFGSLRADVEKGLRDRERGAKFVGGVGCNRDHLWTSMGVRFPIG
jgi:hypothetical protein